MSEHRDPAREPDTPDQAADRQEHSPGGGRPRRRRRSGELIAATYRRPIGPNVQWRLELYRGLGRVGFTGGGGIVVTSKIDYLAIAETRVDAFTGLALDDQAAAWLRAALQLLGAP